MMEKGISPCYHFPVMTDDLQSKLAALEAENRALRVGGGSTFEELETAGKAGGGRVYQFQELLSLPAHANEEATAPPLVFIHVPKTGGTTINHILMKNFRYRMDSYGSSFFPRYFPNEFAIDSGNEIEDSQVVAKDVRQAQAGSQAPVRRGRPRRHAGR